MVNDKKKEHRFAIAVIAVAAVMLVAATTEMAITGYVFASNRNQATASTNDCGNGQMPTNVGCQNIGSQIQGDGNSVALAAQQTFPTSESTPPPTDTATLIISKIVQCVPGQDCPDLPDPNAFMITVEPFAGPPLDPVEGSATGVPVTIPAGGYSLFETIPPEPDGLDFVGATYSEDCQSVNGPIEPGQVRNCQIINTYEEEATPTGFTVTGSGSTTGASFVCDPAVPPGLAISIEFSAQSDGDVTGTYTISAPPFEPFIGELTDGTTDGNTFTLSGVGVGTPPCIPVVVPNDVTISGDCGNDVTITYRDDAAVGTFTGDVECTLT